MNLLVDENVVRGIALWLQGQGHEVVYVTECGLHGKPDDDVFAYAVENALWLLTMDRDFGRVQRFPPNQCKGVVLAKIYHRPMAEVTRIFADAFVKLDWSALEGRLVMITADGTRVRQAFDS